LRPYGLFGKPGDQAPDAIQEAVLPFHIGVIPFQILFRWRFEQDEHAGGVGPVLGNHIAGGDPIALGFRHGGVEPVAAVPRFWDHGDRPDSPPGRGHPLVLAAFIGVFVGQCFAPCPG
jgi:hypothetical protein